MTRKDADTLAPGLYLVHWKKGGRSLAAVGQMKDGARWLAPANWLSPDTRIGAYWRDVARIELMHEALAQTSERSK